MILLLFASVSAQCTDSDGGKNKYESGIVTEQEESFQDTCDGEKHLHRKKRKIIHSNIIFMG
ncbi:MAG: hypothetical protein QT08_C0009G0067 [archaeon GW2011_AR17]|nr:MAG: hypothetical protein QT08_C0009G0067 [archaeon GW2011_AR17]